MSTNNSNQTEKPNNASTNKKQSSTIGTEETPAKPQASERRDTQLYAFINKLISETRTETKTYFIAALILIAVIGYFLNQNDVRTQTEIGQLNKNLSFALANNDQLQKNIRALGPHPECFTCHNDASLLLPKTTLSMEEFIGYVRGNKRFVKNTIMPSFGPNQISDQDLQKIWKTLY